MSRATPPRSNDCSPTGDSPRTPRGTWLRDRVGFFENVVSTQGCYANSENPAVDIVAPLHSRSPSSRASDSSFEESFERLVEEGDFDGAKIVKFEKIIVRKSVREIMSMSVTPIHSNKMLSESNKTSSEEHVQEESNYQSHGIHNRDSKSSSVTSFTKCLSEESLSSQRDLSSQLLSTSEDKSSSDWYTEYHNQTFQNVSARMEYVRSRSEYDAHIAQIKGFLRIMYILSFMQYI